MKSGSMTRFWRNKTECILTGILSLFLSFSLVIGYQVSNLESFSVGPLTIAAFAIVSVVSFASFTIAWRHLDRPRDGKPIRRRGLPISRRDLTVAFAIIIVCWLPVLLAGWPGYFTYDAGTEYLMQWGQIESGVLNAHHPIIHTLFLGLTIKAGMALFGTFNAGVAFSVVVQAILIAAVFLYALRWMARNGLGRRGFWLSVAYLALDPMISLFAFCTTKDSLFAAAVLMYCLSLGDLYSVRRADSGSLWRKAVAVAAFSFLIAILRSNALAALFLIIPIVGVVMWRERARWKVFVSFSVIALLIAAAWLGPISSLVGVEKSPIGKWNSLCMAEQQIARCSVSDAVSDEDKARILFDLPGIVYKENLSDIARVAFMHKACDATELVRLYGHLGLAYPGVYVEAILLQTEDAWSLFSVVGNTYGTDEERSSVFSMGQAEPATRESLCQPLLDGLTWLTTYKEGSQIPILGLIFSISFYVLITLACFVRVCATRNVRGAIVLVPLLVLTLSNFFGPCMLIRYFLYLFYSLPVMLFVAFGNNGRPMSMSGRATEDSVQRK